MPSLQRLVIACAVTLLGGCATSADRAFMLDSTLLTYEKAIRWSNFQAAYSFYRPESGEPPVPDESLRKIRVSGYEVRNQAMGPDGLQVYQVVEIRYYHEDSPRVRAYLDEQHWKYDADRKRWYLASPPPTFK